MAEIISSVENIKVSTKYTYLGMKFEFDLWCNIIFTDESIIIDQRLITPGFGSKDEIKQYHRIEYYYHVPTLHLFKDQGKILNIKLEKDNFYFEFEKPFFIFLKEIGSNKVYLELDEKLRSLILDKSSKMFLQSAV